MVGANKMSGTKEIAVLDAEGQDDAIAKVLFFNQFDEMPKVSVIIPVYNSEEYLKECLDSVVNQTIKEIEIICVDDGSSDNSLAILKEYAQNDHRITVLSQENLHAGVARNAGLAVAKGEYIHFLDSDDWVGLDTYEKLYNLIRENNVPFLKFRSYTYDNQSKQIVNRYFTNMGAVKEAQFNKYLSFKKDYKTLINVSDAPWSGIYSRKFLVDNHILFDNLLCANDTSFFYRCLVNADRILLVKDRFVYYRINNSTSLIGNRAYHFDCQIKQFSIIQEIVKDCAAPIIEAVRKHLIHAVFFRYSNYLKDASLDARVKDKIRNEVKAFSACIGEDEVTDDYLGYYRSLKHDVQVSVIIPVYNTAKYLKECLDSVINQTLRNIEIICIDDCSTDSSLEILNKYAERDSRIKVIHNDHNLGAPGAVKNIGIKIARGEYLGFVDSDDYVDLDYFEKLYFLALVNDSDVAASLKTVFFGQSNRCRIFDCPEGALTTARDKFPLIKVSGSNCSKIYRKEMILKNHIFCCEIRNIAEDNYFSMLSMIMSNNIVATSDTAYYYRRRKHSITSDLRRSSDFLIFDIYKSIDQYVVDNVKNKIDRQAYLEGLNLRKVQDFTWFKADCDPEYIEEFKSKLQSQYPDICKEVFGPPVVISLTSYPARINTVHLAVKTLLNQSKKADKVILWLAPEQFPNREKDLPESLLKLLDYGLTIDWYHDIKSYKKVIPSLRKYPDAIIVTADDDLIYHTDWLSILYRAYQSDKDTIWCHRAHRIKFNKRGEILPYSKWRYSIRKNIPSALNFCTSGGGVLFPPQSFCKDVLDEEKFKRIAPNADDIWLWAMCILNNKKINVVDNNLPINEIEGTQEVSLWHDNVYNNQNDVQLHNLFKEYPCILKRLQDADKSSSILKAYLFFPYYLWKLTRLKREIKKNLKK